MFIGIALLIASSTSRDKQSTLPKDWNSQTAGEKVMSNLIKVIASQVKGAHDAEFTFVGDKAYVVVEVNDSIPGEGAGWPFIFDWYDGGLLSEKLDIHHSKG